MALLAREFQWAGRCVEVTRHSVVDRGACVRVGAPTGPWLSSITPMSTNRCTTPETSMLSSQIDCANLSSNCVSQIIEAPGAQEKFLEIRNAYQTLVDGQSRSKYDASRRTRSNDWDPFQWSGSSRKSSQEEEFYGVGEFFRDVQADFGQSATRSAKPKSLWEELADIGEEFVEFLEKEQFPALLMSTPF